MTCSLSRRTAIALALALAGARGALADIDAIDMPIENLVELRILSMPKFAENVDKIPSVVSILRREDIRAYGWRTVGEALRSLAGFNVTSDHTYQYSGVRGVSAPSDYRPRLQILIDGMSINENIYGGAYIDKSFPLDIDLVERIEVVRGPSASIFGGDAMFGVINIVTRSGQDLDGVEAGAAYSSGDRKSGRLSWGGTIAGADVLASLSGFDGDGRTLEFRDAGLPWPQDKAHNVDGESGQKVFLRARGTDWRFTLTSSEREKIVPTGSYGTIFDDSGHDEADGYTLTDLAKDWHFGDKLKLQQRLYVGDYRYDGHFPFDYTGIRVLNRDRARGRWWGFDNSLSATLAERHAITIGLEYRDDFNQNQLNYDIGYGCYENPGPEPCFADKHSSTQLTVFLQDEVQLGGATHLTLGLRHDHLSDFGNLWSPRLGVTHDADALGIFKLLYGTAYRTPSVYERFYGSDTYQYGNPDLRREKMKSLELTWEKSVGVAGNVTAALYHFDVDRLISTDGFGVAQNGGHAIEAEGLELGYEQRWENRVSVRANYSLQRTTDGVGTVDNSPRQMLKANLSVPLWPTGLGAGIEGQVVSRRQVGAGVDAVGRYALFNLNLLYAPPGRPWDVSFAIYNLFDRNYDDPAAPDTLDGNTVYAYPQLGRSLMLKFHYRFGGN